MGTGNTNPLFVETKQSCSGHSLANKYITPAEQMPDNSVTIIDGMLLIQKVIGSEGWKDESEDRRRFRHIQGDLPHEQ